MSYWLHALHHLVDLMQYVENKIKQDHVFAMKDILVIHMKVAAPNVSVTLTALEIELVLETNVKTLVPVHVGWTQNVQQYIILQHAHV